MRSKHIEMKGPKHLRKFQSKLQALFHISEVPDGVDPSEFASDAVNATLGMVAMVVTGGGPAQSPKTLPLWREMMAVVSKYEKMQ